MSIVINTPTSNIGRALAARLLDAGERITVLSRDKKKVDDFAVAARASSKALSRSRPCLPRRLRMRRRCSGSLRRPRGRTTTTGR